MIFADRRKVFLTLIPGPLHASIEYIRLLSMVGMRSHRESARTGSGRRSVGPHLFTTRGGLGDARVGALQRVLLLNDLKRLAYKTSTSQPCSLLHTPIHPPSLGYSFDPPSFVYMLIRPLGCLIWCCACSTNETMRYVRELSS